MRILALGGIAGPLVLSTMVVVCGSLRPDYDHLTQFISELGARGTANALLFNVAGFVPAGALIAAFGLSLFKLLPPARFSNIGAGLITLFGVGTFLSAVFPCEPGCPQHEPTIHDSIGAISFLLAVVATGLLARVFRASQGWHWLWGYSAISSAAGLCFFVGLVSSLESRELTGLWQRLVVGTIFVWCAVVGATAFRVTRGEGPRV